MKKKVLWNRPLVSYLTVLDLVVSILTNINISSCLVKSNLAKLETSPTEILPPPGECSLDHVLKQID